MAKSFLRIRPIASFSSKDQNSVYYKLDDTKIECRPPASSQCFKNSKSNIKELKKKIFEFDKVLDENADQEQLYNDCVQPLLTEFFNGENVLLFAYGTTSSGKTFTMRGDAKNPGVVPRCISDIFQSVHHKLMVLPNFKKTRFNECEQLSKFELKKETEIKSTILGSVDDRLCNLSDFKFRPEGFKSFLKDDENICHIVWVSFLELYNENLVDLLSINSSSPIPFAYQSTSNASNNERSVPLKIMRDQQQNFFVSGLTQVYVTSAEEAMKVYLFGLDNLKKHISSTAMNRTSSRSHSLFTISVITLKKKSQSDYRVIHVNNFSLCDLAGQERGKKTQTTGIHQREAGMINKSLFSLKRCIQIIKDKKNSSSQLVVPFTESMLTKAFQPYLLGSGLTFMIININPKGEHFDETINSLEFSATALQVVTVRNDSCNSLKDKIQRLTQFWLQTSKRWSTVQDFTNNQTSVFITNNLTSKYQGQNSKSTSDGNDLIVDSQNILNNQKFDSTFFEESITQKVREMEEMVVEYDLYDAQVVEDLKNQIDELELQIENADRNADLNKEVNLESIYNSIAEIYERHEAEKLKIKERMNKLMDERMGILSEEHKYEAEEFEKEIEDLNLQLMCKESELERYKKDMEMNSEHIAKLTRELQDLQSELERYKKDKEVNSEHIAKLTKELLDLQVAELLNSMVTNVEKERFEELTKLNEQNLHRPSTLFTTSILSIENENCPSSSHLNSTTQQQFEHQSMQNADHLLDSMVSTIAAKEQLEELTKLNEQFKNEIRQLKNEKEQFKNEIKQFKVLLDLKDDDIKRLKIDNQRIHKEINKTIKEEGVSMISSSHANITKNLYTSVLNHTSIVGNSTPFKPLSQLASARKKRPIEDDSQLSSDARYLDFIKQGERSPTTEKKTKKKRTTAAVTKSKIKEEIRIEEKIDEEEDDDIIVDDLQFLIEGTAKKTNKLKPKKVSFELLSINVDRCLTNLCFILFYMF